MIRKNRKHDLRSDEDVSENLTLVDEDGQTPFESVEQAELRRRVQRALSRLGSKHRDVVRMHDLEGYTIREIADELNVAEGTVKSRLFYGREELKRYLAN
jgi:RNA polymerase sigma-70 factor (ECF subfamily)